MVLGSPGTHSRRLVSFLPQACLSFNKLGLSRVIGHLEVIPFHFLHESHRNVLVLVNLNFELFS